MSASTTCCGWKARTCAASPSTNAAPALEAWIALKERPRFDLSPLVTFTDWAELAAKREEMRADGIEGLMLKRGDSTYLAGRPKGPWFKWKRDPHAGGLRDDVCPARPR